MDEKGINSSGRGSTTAEAPAWTAQVLFQRNKEVLYLSASRLLRTQGSKSGYELNKHQIQLRCHIQMELIFTCSEHISPGLFSHWDQSFSRFSSSWLSGSLHAIQTSIKCVEPRRELNH
jgi:hypothetical protein